MINMLTMNRERALLAAVAAAAFIALSAPHAKAGFSLGDASNFGVLYDGSSSTLSMTSATITGNVGAGGGSVYASGTTVDGDLDFAQSNVHQSHLHSTTVSGTINYSQSNVSPDLQSMHNLSLSLQSEGGTILNNIDLNGTGGNYTINASQGELDLQGDRVFWIDASNFTFDNGNTITINGDAAGDSVVFNITGGDIAFGGGIVLNGLDADQVLFNVADGNNVTIDSNQAMVQGVFLDPTGTMSLDNSVLNGRFYGGSGGDMTISNSSLIDPLPDGGAVPEPSSLALMACAFLGFMVTARGLPARAKRA